MSDSDHRWNRYVPLCLGVLLAATLLLDAMLHGREHCLVGRLLAVASGGSDESGAGSSWWWVAQWALEHPFFFLGLASTSSSLLLAVGLLRGRR